MFSAFHSFLCYFLYHKGWGRGQVGNTFPDSLAARVLNETYGLPTRYTQERFAKWKESRVCLFGMKPKGGQAG